MTTLTTESVMNRVSVFEGDLLTILFSLLHKAPLEPAFGLIRKERNLPAGISRVCAGLVEEGLSKGCVEFLVRQGGWRRARFLRDDGERIASGRLWERTIPAQLGLQFSAHTLRFLIWITAVNPGNSRVTECSLPEPNSLTLGDRLFLFLVYDRLRETELAEALRAIPAFGGEALLWLAFPEDFLECAAFPSAGFLFWVKPENAWVLETFQSRLEKAWTRIEQQKQAASQWIELEAAGELQTRLLNSYLDAVAAAQRCDLAQFVLHAAANAWSQPLKNLAPVDRPRLVEAAAAFFHVLERLRQWEQSARNVSYFDEGYAASQLWKEIWEQVQGDALCGRGRK